MRDPRYARRRRAAVPAALAALTLLVVVSGARTPPTWAGGSALAPAMTIVLPAQQVAPAPAPPAATPDEPPDEPLPLPLPLDGGPVDPAPAPVPDTAPDDGGDRAPAGNDGGDDDDDPGDAATAAVRHVFVVMLSQTDLVALAGDAQAADPANEAAAPPAAAPPAAAPPAAAPPAAPYFAGRLVPQGTLLTGYDAIARGSLANGVALLSGQGPTTQTLADCPTAAGAPPPDVTPDTLGDDGQQLGDGCVYPFATGTMPDQLTGAGLDWRAYVEDASGPCPATPRDPFAYFHSLLDAGACARHVAGIDRLDADLARGRDAPALLWIVPNACHDGQAAPCAQGAAAGPTAADAFLRDLIPRLLASAAYADGGLIAITSDGPPPAPAPTVPTPPAFAATYPNVGDAAAAGAARVGALLISPSVPAGERSAAPANHVTLLRAISDLFALQPLGYAGSPELQPLPARVLKPNEQ